ncbi:hypothetical protein KBD49_03370 [Myxococcota bacterium]|nr:hypothetical protein [Myxococcota bacterium]
MSDLALDPGLVDQLLALAREVERLTVEASRGRPRNPGWRASVLEQCQRARQKAESLAQALRATGQTVGDSCREARQQASDRVQAMSATLDRIQREAARLADQLTPDATRMSLKAYIRSLGEAYEDLRRQLKPLLPSSFLKGPALERLKLTQYRRNLFHVGNGLAAAIAYPWLLTRQQALIVMSILLGIVVVLEITRRLWGRWNEVLTRKNPMFRSIIRPWEKDRPNSASWYVLSLFLLALLVPPPAAQMAVLILGFGDPMASLVGRRFGSIKIHRRKSLQGSLALFLVALLVSLLVPWMHGLTMGIGARLGMAFTVALGATLAELYSDVVDDNLTVTLGSGGIAAIWMTF